jgi:hypothetical protein
MVWRCSRPDQQVNYPLNATLVGVTKTLICEVFGQQFQLRQLECRHALIVFRVDIGTCLYDCPHYIRISPLSSLVQSGFSCEALFVAGCSCSEQQRDYRKTSCVHHKVSGRTCMQRLRLLCGRSSLSHFLIGIRRRCHESQRVVKANQDLVFTVHHSSRQLRRVCTLTSIIVDANWRSRRLIGCNFVARSLRGLAGFDACVGLGISAF